MAKHGGAAGSSGSSAQRQQPNVAAARTLDSVARSAPAKPRVTEPVGPGELPPREPMWQPIGPVPHLLVVLTIAMVALAAYSNSFSPGSDRPPGVNWTLDNKYIIELDPRTKAKTWNDTLPEPGKPSQPGFVNIWTKDYWWPKGISGLYRPIVTFTYWVNWYVIGGDESTINPSLPPSVREDALNSMMSWRLAWFHIANYLAHVGVAVLIYFLGLTLTHRFWVSAAMALLFVTHPVAVESVTNIIGRADIFAALTTVGGLLLYIRSTRSPGLWKLPWLIGLMLLTLFGEFSKESAIAVMGIVPLYDLIFRFSLDDAKKLLPTLRMVAVFALAGIVLAGLVFLAGGLFVTKWWESPKPLIVASVILVIAAFSGLIAWVFTKSYENNDWEWAIPWKKYILPYAIAFLVPLVTLVIVRSWVAANATPAETPFLDNPIRGESWFAGRLTAAQVMVRLLAILIWPYHLSCDYSFNQFPVYGAWLTRGVDVFGIFSAVLIAAALLLAVAMWRRNKPLAFYILFFFITYFPTSNFVLTIGSIMAERFLYLPLIGFIGVGALLLEYLCRRASDAISESFAATAADRLFTRNVVFSSVISLLAILYGVRTFVRNRDWRSDVTLWQSAKDISPQSFRSYQSYAFALFEETQLPKEKRQPETRNVTIDQCIEWASKGRPIVDPLPDKFNSSRLYLHLGMYNQIKASELATKGPNGEVLNNDRSQLFFAQAIEALEHGVPIDRAFNKINRQKELERGKKLEDIPDVGLLQVYQYLGDAYIMIGRPFEALDAYKYMRHLDPTSADGYVKVAQVYATMNTPELANSDPARAAGNMEQAAIAIVQALWLDASRTFLWPPLEQMLARLNREPNVPVVVKAADGRPRLVSQNPLVQSVICSAYQGFVRLFLESRLVPQAEFIYITAVRDAGFPKPLFDDIYKEFGRTSPAIPPRQPPAGEANAPPPPSAAQQPGGAAALPKPNPREAPGNVR